jgi:hypothetical protein
MRNRIQPIIDVAAALLLIALLFLPAIDQNAHKVRAKDNAVSHRFTVSARHHRADHPTKPARAVY